ncbi:apoptosis facilitator Bcl-2-like protein 14 [Elgaria multicarinata webbii]|uniref:apoptosis facilitator Bcl-2-like protein 14 n=1 Tax=Elgaria multicarinata webbii TaxID=159646 RepID=UPI002FCD581B
MNLANSSSMEEISLDDVDRTSTEYRVLMAYAQRRLSASKYGQLLKREAKGQEGSPLGTEDVAVAPIEGLSPESQEQPARKRTKKKRGRPNWKHLLIPSCLRPQANGELQNTLGYCEGSAERHTCMSKVGVGSVPTFPAEVQDDSDITPVADRLAEIVDNYRSYPESTGFKSLERTVSIEEDCGATSKPVDEENDGKDEEAKIIDTIVDLLRKSGDELQEKVQKDKTFSQCFSDLMSYAFFTKVADQFLEKAIVDSATDCEGQVQSTKIAFAMEVTTRLTAMDSHPMNIVLGFGTKYLKEHFSSWIYSQGGWEKALGLPDEEDVE